MSLVIGENSYVDVTEADAYFVDRLYSDVWGNAVQQDKERALIMATKKIDRQPLRGIKADPSQKLQFPRAMYSYDSGGLIVETEISQAVKDATCEEALAILQGIPKRIELQQQGVKAFTMSDVSETYTGSLKKLLSQEAIELLAPYLAGSVAIK